MFQAPYFINIHLANVIDIHSVKFVNNTIACEDCAALKLTVAGRAQNQIHKLLFRGNTVIGPSTIGSFPGNFLMYTHAYFNQGFGRICLKELYFQHNWLVGNSGMFVILQHVYWI